MKCCAILLMLLISVVRNPSVVVAQGKPYRGAEYRTIGTMTYGRFEVRMRPDQVSGTLGSFFTYYDPANPWNEIDVEIMGRYSNEVQFNTIAPAAGAFHVQRYVLPFNPHHGFHVYSFDWTPDYVAWGVDGTEVYRQTGTHISQITEPQKVMMNIWQSSDVTWAGSFDAGQLPVYAVYDWVRYSTYTPGTGDNFTVQWTDNFDSFDPSRWQRATHTWDGNNSQFVQQNVAFENGYMILCLTDSVHLGYDGAPIIDTDTDPPTVVTARASMGRIRVLFSEELDRVSAESPGDYVLPGGTVEGASLLSDGRSVDLAVSGLNLTGNASLIVLGVKDLAGNAMGAASIGVIMPLPFPLKINVGAGALSGYLGDSVWNFSSQYGAVGGNSLQQPSTLDIAGTTEDEIYRSAREGLSFYNIRVPPGGMYDVTLLFAETAYQAAGQRVFDVRLNGSQASRIDLVQQAGFQTAFMPTFHNVSAPEGLIAIYLAPVVGLPVLSGIRIEPVSDGVGSRLGENEVQRGIGVYPNPFNGATNLVFSLREGRDVELQVFDILGRLVRSLPLGFQEKGQHAIRWDGQNLASGVYLCAISEGSQLLTRRVLLLR